ERRLDVGDAAADVAALLAFLALGHGVASGTSAERRAGGLCALRPVHCGVLLPAFLHALLAREGLARALAGPGGGPCPLPAHERVAAVADAAVAADLHQPLDVLLDLAAERALHRVLAVEDGGDAGDLVVGQLLGPAERIDARLLAHLQRPRRPDA